ncbi:MAG: hypothetical protein ACOCWO_04570 [Candidatus Muiribacteriaceae bacterium]
MRKINRKGNTLVLSLVILLVVSIMGMALLANSISGKKQAEILFQGMDANMLLEGLIKQAENIIRRQANNYKDQPEWFKIFRNTDIGSTSSWKTMSLSGKPILHLGADIADEMEVKARFIANSEVMTEDSSGNPRKMTYGEEKFGQLEFQAKVLIGDDYYHAHAAKDVKVICPLALSHDGDYNGIHKYNLYVKYMFEEFAMPHIFGKNADGLVYDDSVTNGNFKYNKLSDESKEDKKIQNMQYYLTLNNGTEDNRGKVYLGTSKENRDLHKSVIFIDLPRKEYGKFYSEILEQETQKINKKSLGKYTFEFPDDVTQPVEMAVGEEFKLVRSILGDYVLQKYYDILVEQMSQSTYTVKEVDEDGNETEVEKDGDDFGELKNPPGPLKQLQIGAGIFISGPEYLSIRKSVTGWEYAQFPYTLNHESPGKVELLEKDDSINIKVNHPEEQTKKVGNLPPHYPMITYNLFFNEKYLIRDGRKEDFRRYFSVSQSSFASDSLFSESNIDDGYRAQPTLQLHGYYDYDNGKFASPTEIEGNVLARWAKIYYLVTDIKDTDNGEHTITYYSSFYPRTYLGQDILDTVKDLLETDKEDKNGKTPSDKYTKVKDDEKSAQEKSDMKKSAEQKFYEGPEVRKDLVDYKDPDGSEYNSVLLSRPFDKTATSDDLMGMTTSDELNGVDPDFGNIYLDKVTSVYYDSKDFYEHNAKYEDGKMVIYLNGIFMIDSGINFDNDASGELVYEYRGKGAILCAGDILISSDIKPADPEHDLLILGTIGRRSDSGNLTSSRININSASDDKKLEIQASLLAMNRDLWEGGASGKNMGKDPELSCSVNLSYGAYIYGNWMADWLDYYPVGHDGDGNENLKGTELQYDPRLANDDSKDILYYLADIGRGFSFYKIWKIKKAES